MSAATSAAAFSATSTNPAYTYNASYIPWTGRSFNSSGFMGGGYLGYNYQVNQNFVVGLEGDFQGTTNSQSATWAPTPVLYPLASVTAKSSLDWLGAINGRLGVAYDRALFYAIGGAAAGAASASAAPLITRAFPWSASRRARPCPATISARASSTLSPRTGWAAWNIAITASATTT